MSVTKSQVIRSVLKEMGDDLDSVDKKEVLGIARERMRQQGGDSSSMTVDCVRFVMGNIQSCLGGPLTRAKVEEYETLPGVVNGNVEETTPTHQTNIEEVVTKKIVSISQAIRMAMKQLHTEERFDLSDNSNEGINRVKIAARKILKDSGVNLSVSNGNVSTIRHGIKKMFGLPITVEKIQQYENQLDSTRIHPMKKSSKKKKGKSKATVANMIREILRHEELNPVDTGRVLVLLRAKLAQHKMDKRVDRKTISDVVGDIRRTMGDVLTPEKIDAYERQFKKSGIQKQKVEEILNKVSSVISEVESDFRENGLDMDSLIDSLHDAFHFSQSVGGVDNAITVLNKLKGLSS